MAAMFTTSEMRLVLLQWLSFWVPGAARLFVPAGFEVLFRRDRLQCIDLSLPVVVAGVTGRLWAAFRWERLQHNWFESVGLACRFSLHSGL
jgi:hypothetical protein